MSETNIESLRHNARRIMREYGFLNKLPRGEDISASQVHALVEIGRNPDCTASQLRSVLRLDKSSVTHVTKQLLNKGWIGVNQGEEDARQRDFHLTRLGLSRLNLSNVRAQNIVKNALSLLSEQEKEMVIKGMELYADALDKSSEKLWTIQRLSHETAKHGIVQFIGQIQKKEHNVRNVDEVNKSVHEADIVFEDSQGNVNFWCAYSDDEIVGTIGLQEISPGIGELKKCFVAEEFRGTGLAQELFATLLHQAVESCILEVYLGTTGLHKGAMRFYEKNMFERIKRDELPKGFEACELDNYFYKCYILAYFPRLDLK